MKRLLLVPDVKFWAWWYMAQGIAKYAPPEYEVQVLPNNGGFGEITKYTPGALMDYAGICQFSWTEATTPGKGGVHWNHAVTVVASHGLEFPYPNPDRDYLPGRIATRLRNRDKAAEKLPQFDRVICVSEALTEAAQQFNHNSVFCLPGVDDEVFYPGEKPEGDGRLRVGWCGQKNGVTKGYKEVLEPLMAALGDEKFDWRINTRDQHDPLTQEQMAQWYRGLDVFMSTSCSEGCQMPILEAMASGVPVVATACGTATRCGWLVVPPYETAAEVRRTIDSLARNLAGYLAEKESGRQSRDPQHCRRYAENTFSWKQRAAKWCRAIAGEPIEESE